MKYQKLDLLAFDLEAAHAKPDLSGPKYEAIRKKHRDAWLARRKTAKFAWDEAAHKRAKTSEASTPGSFAPTAGANAKEAVPRAPEGSLSEAQRKVEARAADFVHNHYEEAKAKYATLPDSEGGKVLNTDIARELFHEYNMARALHSASVHEPASYFIKRLYEERLAMAAKPDEMDTVLFTAGGTGAGKSYALKQAIPQLQREAQTTYDTNMANADSAIKKIDMALAKDRSVSIAYVWRDPVESFKNGAIPRAVKQEAKYGKGNGRTTPIDVFLSAHIGAREAVEKVTQHYAKDKRVRFLSIANGTNPKTVSLSQIPKFKGSDREKLKTELLGILETEYKAGRISESIYRGFKGH